MSEPASAAIMNDRRRLALGTFVLLTAFGFSSLVGTALTPVLSAMGQHFGGGAKGALTAQNIVTIASIGTMIGAPLVGLLTRWLSTSQTLVLGLTIYAVAGSSGLYIDSTGLLLGARLIQGIGAASVTITTAAMIADRFEGNARARILGYRDALLAVVGFLALNGSGMLADAAGWRTNFAIYLLAVPYIGLVLAARFPTPAARSASTSADRTVLIKLWPLYLMVLVLYMVAYTPYLNLSFLMAEDHITSAAIQGRIIATSTVLHFFASMLYGRLVGGIGTRWVFALTLAIMAISEFLIGFSQGTVWIVAGMGLAGLSGGYLQVYLTNLFLSRTTAATRGQALGFMVMAMQLGQFVDPYVTTPLRAFAGNHEAFILVGAVLSIAALAQAYFGRAQEAETA
ncbi:MAG: MFS transporter [Rhodospirillaceae bacterium]|nr:MFS transporter [Rhodospirillaceae bacterium]